VEKGSVKRKCKKELEKRKCKKELEKRKCKKEGKIDGKDRSR